MRAEDRWLNLTQEVVKHLKDDRNPQFIQYSNLDMLQQKMYSLVLGYEDLNNQQTLRSDPVLQVAVEKGSQLTSPSTLCRFENRCDKDVAIGIHEVLISKFIESLKNSSPKELIAAPY